MSRAIATLSSAARILAQQKKDISAHYDLGNDFYRTFLDTSMTYSCARFLAPEETLEQAQINKLRGMITKAQIGPADHVLEIGCGWGSFAVEAVRQTGCRVTGITVSNAQMEWARERVRQAEALGKALVAGGSKVERGSFPGEGLQGHAEINRRLGDPTYAPTRAVDAWLKQVFGR